MRSFPAAFSALPAVFPGVRRALINPLLVLLIGAAAVLSARADGITAKTLATTENGYGRLAFTFSQEIKTDVQVSNGIVVIKFAQPVAVAADKIAAQLPGYVQAVRLDPDHGALRLALGRQATVNVMKAAEKLFIDLLPSDWVGLPPGLPKEVVDDLAQRAHEAERRAQMNEKGPPKKWAPIRLRYATAPTFSRFGFEMAEPITVATARDGQELRLTFNAPVKIDFGEAQAKLPSSVVGLNAAYDPDTTTVKLVLAPDAVARTFRDDAAFVVDVTPPPAAAAPKDVEAHAPPPEPIANKQPAKAAPPAKQELAAVAPDEPVEKAVAIVKPAAPVAPPPVTAPPLSEPVVAAVSRQDGNLTITLPFGEPVAGALFRHDDEAWIVLDTARTIRWNELENDSSHLVRGITQEALPNGRLIKLSLDPNRLVSMEGDGESWKIDVGGTIANPGRPLPARRIFVGENRAGVFVPLASPGRVHDLKDPGTGNNLVVITAKPPARSVVRGQRFVEFSLLATKQGIVLSPKADDLIIELSQEGVTVTRPHGLVVSDMGNVLPPLPSSAKTPEQPLAPLDFKTWQDERDTNFLDRQVQLSRALSEAPLAKRAEKRVAFARFYLARDLAAEALGVLEATSEDESQTGSESAFALLHGLAELRLGRASEAFHDFSKHILAKVPQAALLRSSALTRLTRWSEARDQFEAGKRVVSALPLELQRVVLRDAMRCAIEVNDFAEAGTLRNELEVVGIPAALQPSVAVLSARLAQGIGRTDQAESEFEKIANGPESPAMAEARLRLIEMRLGRGSLDQAKAIDALEQLSFAWRGDETEIETMHLLAKLYVAEAHYRAAFNLLDAALLTQPNSDTTRTFYTEMAAVFEDLFLSAKAESVPPIEALAIYYDFSKLTPIGRRGDELIRRLADRLVSVDLLDQAAELLDYQVQFRLTGAAKAQVAAKLAWVQLMNAKPAKALQALASTRTRDLPQDLRDQRLLLEARALSETHRYDAALELVAGVSSIEGERLRADILWSAKRWREAGEAFEKMLGDRWKKAAALDQTERQDVLRAGLAFALGNETIGLTRLRDRYSSKMTEGPERKAFAIVSASTSKDAGMLGEVAKTLSTVDSLKVFLRLYQARFPDKPLPDTATTASATPRLSQR